MSGGLYAKSGSVRDVHSGKDKESILDIYVSAESLKVYDKPWVESTSPNVSGHAGGHNPVPLVIEKTRKRSHMRSSSLFLAVLCLLLLIGIICLGVQMNKDKNNWDRERQQLLADNADLCRRNDQLKANNTELSKERDDLQHRLFEEKKNPRKSETLAFP